jgi:hypothetical protein
VDGSQIIEKSDLERDILDTRPDFSAFRRKSL